jgi:predicted site-specific integrase-resolvase
MNAPSLRPDTPDISALPADALLTRNQVAALSGFALQTLKMWPAQGKGPRVTTVEGRPRYRVADVRQWMGA